MKTKIYYFSTTGNSLAAAKQIAEELGECEIISAVTAMNKGVKRIEAERVIFITPVYYGFLPTPMNSFIESLEELKAEEISAVATCHQKMGFIEQDYNRLLKKHNIKLTYFNYVKMIDNYLPFFTMPDTNEMEKLLDESEDEIKAVISDINNGKREYNTSPRLIKPIFSFVHGRWHRKRLTSDKYFKLNNNCTGCAICEKMCPVDNITINKSIPAWNGGCEACQACIQNCPSEAIHWKKSNDEKGRYRHRNVAQKELLNGLN